MEGQTRSSSRKRLMFAVILTCALAFAASSPAPAQGAVYKVGDLIEAEWRSGRWYEAQIIELNAGQYKVRYTLDGVTASVTADKLRPVGGGANARAKGSNIIAVRPPPMAGGFPVIPGSAWKIDWGKRGANVQVFLFCKTGRWEVVSPMLLAGAATIMGTYRVRGSNVVTKGDDGSISNYTMTWKGDALEMNDGRTIMRLVYNGIAQC